MREICKGCPRAWSGEIHGKPVKCDTHCYEHCIREQKETPVATKSATKGEL